VKTCKFKSHCIKLSSSVYLILFFIRNGNLNTILSLCQQTSELSIRYNLISTCAGECDWLFHWQHKLCATFSANVNINCRLQIKVYYRICTLRHIRIEINHGSQNVLLSFNMNWQILVNFIPRFWLGIKY
jgi:hypothetical protein